MFGSAVEFKFLNKNNGQMAKATYFFRSFGLHHLKMIEERDVWNREVKSNLIIAEIEASRILDVFGPRV
jgi:hypothetical protein